MEISSIPKDPPSTAMKEIVILSLAGFGNILNF
jgi:hypothetical protein